jgi:hypothetical protein
MDSLRTKLFVLLVAVVCVACDKAGSTVRASGAVEVYKTFPKNEPGNKVIAVLKPGDSAPVLATRHSKEFMFYKIRLTDGSEGYVMFGDDFKVANSQGQ